jgi:hypothetical protein
MVRRKTWGICFKQVFEPLRVGSAPISLSPPSFSVSPCFVPALFLASSVYTEAQYTTNKKDEGAEVTLAIYIARVTHETTM